MQAAELSEALTLLGSDLHRHGLEYELVAVGGSALLLLGVISRPTRDVDIVAFVENGSYVKADPFPRDLAEAVRVVGTALGIGAEWLNAGPAMLMDLGLPSGFSKRVVTREFGGLKLHLASRSDLIALKLYAATDQGINSRHFEDLNALKPSRAELMEGAKWTRSQDPSEGFRQELVKLLAAFGVESVREL